MKRTTLRDVVLEINRLNVSFDVMNQKLTNLIDIADKREDRQFFEIIKLKTKNDTNKRIKKAKGV